MSKRVVDWTLAGMRSLADADGVVSVGITGIALKTGRDLKSARYTLRLLERRGDIERLTPGGRGKGDSALFKVLSR